MKMLFHISSLFGGGAERVMSYLINHRVELGDEVIVVVCYEKEGEYPIPNSVKKIVIGEGNLLSQAKKLRKIIKQEKPELCLGFMQGGNVRLTLANMFSKQKYVLSVRNDPKKEYPNLFMRMFAKIFFVRASGIVFQTPDAMNYFSKKIQKKSEIIFNPVSKDFFAKNRQEATAGIVSFGRLVEQKNFKLLINAYSLISNQIEDDLFIYGEGPLKEALEKQIDSLNLQNRVHLMGRTNNVKEILSNSKMFVMSSDFEGMPNALLEAVCMLVPSISTDCPCGGSKIILSDGTGLLVSMNNVDELAKAITNVAINYELRNSMITNSKNNRTKFETEVILQQWNDFFALVEGR